MSMKDELTQYLYNFCCIRYDQLRAMKTLDAKKSMEYHMVAPWKIAVGCLIAMVVIFGIIKLVFGKDFGVDSTLGFAFLTAIVIITLDEKEYIQNVNAGKIIPKKAVVNSNSQGFCLLGSAARAYQYSEEMQKFIRKFCSENNPIGGVLIALNTLDDVSPDIPDIKDFKELTDTVSPIYQSDKLVKDLESEIHAEIIREYFTNDRKSIVKEIIEKLKADKPFDVFAYDYDWMDYAYIALDLENQMKKA